MTCKQCKNFHECESDAFFNEAKFDPDASADCCAGFEPRTNEDWIRGMTNEELVDFIGHNSLCDRIQDEHGGWCKKHAVCKDCLVEWRKQPAEEGAENG